MGAPTALARPIYKSIHSSFDSSFVFLHIMGRSLSLSKCNLLTNYLRLVIYVHTYIHMNNLYTLIYMEGIYLIIKLHLYYTNTHWI